MNEKECFANRKGRCKILTVRKCSGVNCNFYKTKEQLEVEREQALQRISSLDQDRRKKIMDNYYGGKLDLLPEEERL